MTVYFNPLDLACKSVTGGLRQEEILQLNIFLLKEEYKHHADDFYAPEDEWCETPQEDAYLHLNRDGEETDVYLMEKTAHGWRISFKIKEIGLYFYAFSIDHFGFISCDDMQKGRLFKERKSFLLTVYAKDYTTPEWFKGGVLYQIFPDRFCKQGVMPDINGRVHRNWGEDPYFRPNEQGKVLNNDFFGGNFKGIQSKLPYLKSLGVTSIYLNPIFEAASNHRYDTSDYKKLDPILGTEQDFSQLLKAAQESGIRIILDGVFNHTGDDSVYFNKYGHYTSVGAYQSQQSPYYSWYSFQEFPDKYSSWWGIDILPEVNENSEEYQEFIFGNDGVLKKWLRFGIGGYRLDVADELPDFFLKKLRKSVKEEDPNAIIIGEVWEDASDKIAYSKRREYLQGYELDSTMNYPLKDGIIRYIQTENAMELLRIVRTLLDHYPKQTVDCLMNILGTHDTARILTVLGGIYCKNKEEMANANAYLDQAGKEKAIEKLKMAAVLQYTMPGVPCLYYGDENATEGHIDPFCRRCFDWNNLQKDLISFYARLGEIRKSFYSIFCDGEFKEVFIEDGFFVYKRIKDNLEIYVYTNNSSKPYLLNLNGNYKELLSGITFENQMQIEKRSYGIFVKI